MIARVQHGLSVVAGLAVWLIWMKLWTLIL